MKGLAKTTYGAMVNVAEEPSGGYVARVIRPGDRLLGVFAFGDSSKAAIDGLVEMVQLALGSGEYFAKGRFTEIQLILITGPQMAGKFPVAKSEVQP